MWHGRDGRGRLGGLGGCFAVTPLMDAWLLGLYQALSEHLPLLYIYRERERGRRAGGRRCCRCSMTGSQEREDTSVTGLTFHSLGPECQERPLCAAHTLWWHQIEYKSCLLLADEHLSKAFILRFIELDVQPILKIDNDTTRNVCVWFLWILVYLIYSLPFFIQSSRGRRIQIVLL